MRPEGPRGRFVKVHTVLVVGQLLCVGGGNSSRGIGSVVFACKLG